MNEAQNAIEKYKQEAVEGVQGVLEEDEQDEQDVQSVDDDGDDEEKNPAQDVQSVEDECDDEEKNHVQQAPDVEDYHFASAPESEKVLPAHGHSRGGHTQDVSSKYDKLIHCIIDSLWLSRFACEDLRRS